MQRGGNQHANEHLWGLFSSSGPFQRSPARSALPAGLMTSWEEGPVSREGSLWGGEEWGAEGDAEADARVSGFLPGPWGLHWGRGRPTACFLLSATYVACCREGP